MKEIPQIIDDLKMEVLRQLELWGVDFDDKNTANDWAAYICRYVTEGAYIGRRTLYTPVRFREYLKKAAALCISAMAAIDRNGDCAPRHYEGLPGAGSKKENKDVSSSSDDGYFTISHTGDRHLDS